MSEIFAEASLLKYKEKRQDHLICVPASIQFLLPESLMIPISLYEDAIRSDGLLPSEALNALQQIGWITYQAYSITESEYRERFASVLKSHVRDNDILGVGLSLRLPRDSFHFVTARGPLDYDDKTMQVFDTTRNNPVYLTDIDQLMFQAAPNSEYGRRNCWLVYPGRAFMANK